MNKRFKNVLCLLAMALLLNVSTVFAQTNQPDKNKHSDTSGDVTEIFQSNGCFEISAEEAKKAMEEDSTVILLDVRSEEEYEKEHITNAVNLPIDSINQKANEVIQDKGTKIIVYCQKGKRSKKATKMLYKLGYKNIYNLGGIENWPYEKE
ncbi:rhodanese-like domain-containing protein [Clostridium sp. DL1XJH146]